MKKIEAIIRNEKLVYVRAALKAANMQGITVYHVLGKGQQKDLILRSKGETIEVDLLPKTKIELFVDDDDIDKVVDIIKKSACSANIGDGKIIILPIDNVIRIRTGEQGKNAI
ncbi:P-II family nitrogen regulator [Thermoproteota archaeon]